MSWLTRFTNVFRASGVDAELEEELRSHREARVEELVARGMTRAEAEAHAARRFGNALLLREQSRDIKLLPWLESIFKDIRFAARVLRRDAVVTTAAVASLGLAIGACAAAFSLLDALILRPLPVRDPERLVYLTFSTDLNPRGESFSYPVFLQLREAARPHVTLFGMEHYPRRRRAIFAGATGPEEQLVTQFVVGNSFEVLGVRASAGRVLSDHDDAPGARPVAVLSHRFWTRRFGGDPSILGRWFELDGRQLQIVGVVAKGFSGIEPGRAPDVWVPGSVRGPKVLADPGTNWFRILGRLKTGVHPEQARAGLQPVFTTVRRDMMQRFGAALPRDRVERFVRSQLEIHPAANGPSVLRREFERPLWILTAIVALVLLIAGSNVANLLLARAAQRHHELSLRLSIGAGRARLVQQILVESGLLVVTACALGLVFAIAAAPAMVSMMSSSTTSAYLDLRIDWRLLSLLGTVALLTTVAFGLAPAVRASGVSPAGALAATRRTVSRPRLLRPLVAGQVAFSVLVLFVGTLLLLSFAKLTRVDLGFDKSRVLLLQVDANRLPPDVEPRATALQLIDRVRRLPGVRAASMSGWALFSGSGRNMDVRVPGRTPDSFAPYFLEVSPGFFDGMRMRLLAGRTLARGDGAAPGIEPVVVNEAFARRYFEGAAVGRTFQSISGAGTTTQQIIGVIGNARDVWDLRGLPTPMVYLPLRRIGTLQVRAAADPWTLVPAVRRELRAVHPGLSVRDMQLQEALVDNALVIDRVLALLSAFFAAVGLVLAAIGLYGVLSYSVVQRTREIGIRMALGARARAAIESVLRDACVMVATGTAAGLGAGIFLARYVQTLLYDVNPLDASSIAVPIAGLLVAVLIAAVPPARRAARIDPIVALRYE